MANIVATFSPLVSVHRNRYKPILVPDVAAIVLSSSREFLLDLLSSVLLRSSLFPILEVF